MMCDFAVLWVRAETSLPDHPRHVRACIQWPSRHSISPAIAYLRFGDYQSLGPVVRSTGACIIRLLLRKSCLGSMLAVLARGLLLCDFPCCLPLLIPCLLLFLCGGEPFFGMQDLKPMHIPLSTWQYMAI